MTVRSDSLVACTRMVHRVSDDTMRTGAPTPTSSHRAAEKAATKVEPTPGVDDTDTDPPISWHNSLQMNRPRPVPPYSLVVVSSTCENS